MNNKKRYFKGEYFSNGAKSGSNLSKGLMPFADLLRESGNLVKAMSRGNHTGGLFPEYKSTRQSNEKQERE